MFRNRFSVRTLAFAGVSLALAFVLSNIRLFRMPGGGSVTLLSMLFVSLIGWFYGPIIGLTSAFAYGLLQFVTNPVAYSFWQVMFDYIFAFTALGLSGFFRNGKRGLIAGYVLGVSGRFVFSTLSSLIFWTDYAEVTFAEGLWGGIAYNGAYLLPELLITIVLILLPPVGKVLNRMKNIAVKEA